MYKYIYTGSAPVNLKGFGIVMPNQVIEVDFQINNGKFELVKESISKKKRK